MTADGRLPVDQRRNYKHVFDALWTIKKDEGIAGLWRGTTVTLYRAMVSNVSQLLSYDESKKFLSSKCKRCSAIIYRVLISMISDYTIVLLVKAWAFFFTHEANRKYFSPFWYAKTTWEFNTHSYTYVYLQTGTNFCGLFVQYLHFIFYLCYNLIKLY